MGKKTSFLSKLQQDPTSRMYGESFDYQSQIAKLPKLNPIDQAELDAEVEKEHEINKQLEEHELKLAKQKEEEKLAPNDVIEEELLAKGDEKEYTGYKALKDKINQLEQKNYIKQAAKSAEVTPLDAVNPTGTLGWKALTWLADALTLDTTGMSKEEAKTYKELVRQKRAIDTPLVVERQKKYQTMLDGANAQMKDLQAKHEAELKAGNFVGPMIATQRGVAPTPKSKYSAEIEKLAVARNMYEDAIEKMDDFTQGNDDALAGLSTESRNMQTIGLYGAINNLHGALAKSKAKKGEKLSEGDQAILNATAYSQDLDAMGLDKNRFWYRTGEGTGKSAVFMEQAIATAPLGGAIGGATAAVTRPLAKELGLRLLMSDMTAGLTQAQLGKLAAIDLVVGDGTASISNVLAQTAAMPTTYEGTARKYIGQYQIVQGKDGEDKILVTASARKAYEKEANAKLAILSQKENAILNKTNKTPEDLAQLQSIRNDVNNVYNSLQRIYDPSTNNILEDVSAEDAAIYGYTEALKENLAERYVGRLGGAITKPVSKRLAGTTLDKITRPLTDAFAKGNEILNKYSLGRLSSSAAAHTGSAKIFHGLPGEVMEEIAVQLTPSYQEDYGKQLEQLKDPMFYADIVAQTLMLGAGSTAIGSSNHGINYATNKEYREAFKKNREAKKEIADTYRNIDKAITDDNLAEHIVMNTGKSLFDLNEYQGKIASLRNEGKNEEADKLEKKSFTNLAVQAMQTNTLDNFEKSLLRVQRNEGITPKTKENVAAALQVVQEFAEVKEAHSDKVNFGEIANLSINKILAKQTLQDLNTEISKVQREGKEAIDKFNKHRAIGDTNVTSVESMLDALENNTVDVETANTYIKHINALSKDNIGNINKYIELRNFKDLYESLDFQNELDLSNQTNPVNQAKFEAEYKRRKEGQANTIIEKTLNKEAVYDVARNLTGELERNEEILSELVVDGDKRYVQIQNVDTKQIRTLELTQDNKILKKAQEKVAQLEVQEALGVTPGVANMPTERLTEGGTQTEEVDEILAALFNPQPVDSTNPAEPQFSRRSVGNTSDAVKTAAENVISNLSKTLGREPSFREFIESRIEKYSYAEIEKLYNFYEDAWTSTGRDAEDSTEVFDALFNADEALHNAVNAVANILSETEVIQINKETEHSLQEVTAKKTKFDLNNKPQVVDVDDVDSNDRRTLNPSPKAAYNFQDVKRISDTDWKVLSTNLVSAGIVDNTFILEPGFVKPGMKLTVREMDFDDTPVMDYKSDGEIEASTWGALKEKYNIQKGSELWAAKVPMVATHLHNGDVVPLFMIHEPAWYNTKNISDRKSSKIQNKVAIKGSKKTLALRKKILNGQNEIIIESTHFGSMDKLANHKDNTPVSIQDAAGESSTIAVVRKENNTLVLETGKGQIFKEIVDTDINDPASKFKVGQIVDIRPAMQNDQGETVYKVLMTMNNSPIAPQGSLRKDLDKQVYDNIKFATLASSILNNSENGALRQQIEEKYGFTYDKAQAFKNAALKATGINVSSNLADYVSLFVQMGKTNETLDKVANSPAYKTGLTYFDNKFKAKDGTTISNPSAIQVYHKESFNLNAENYDPRKQIGIGGKLTETEGIDAVQITMNNFEKLFHPELGLARKTQFNVNLKYLGKKDIEIVKVNEKGEVVQGENKDYNSYIKQNLRTNILSHEIETISGEKKWILDVQPMFYFESTSEIAATSETIAQAEKAVRATLKEEGVNQNFAEVIEDVTTGLNAEQQEALLNMINNFGNGDIVNSRWAITDDQQDAIQGIKGNNIVGLSSTQNKELVSSLKNLILSSFDFNNKVTLGEVKEALLTSVEKHIVTKLNNDKAIVANLEKQPAERKTVKDDKGNSLQDYINKFQENIKITEAIVEQKDKLISVEKDNLGSITKEFNNLFGTNFEEELGEEEESFSKSFLEKELKSSFSGGLRLSLFGLPILNKQGNVTTSFLNLPKYNNVDDLVNKLLGITSNMPSNWDTLTDILMDKYTERNNPIFKQLKEKLDKLPNDLKNELLYKTVSKKLTVYKVINSPVYQRNSKTGKMIITGYTMQVIDENSSKEDIRLKERVRDGFISSAFGQTNEEFDIVLNTQYATNIQKALQKVIDSGETLDFERTKQIFNFMGLGEFEDNTIREYLKNNDPIGKNTGILWFANEKLKDLLAAEGPVVLTEKKNNLFSNSGKALNTLINLEVMLNGTGVASSIRVAGKTMQGVIANTAIYDTIQDLKNLEDSPLYNAMTKNALTKDNTILQLLKSDSKFNSIFGVDFSSPDAYKVHGKNNFGDTDFDKIAEQDNIATTFALYTNTTHTTLTDPNFMKGLEFRVGQMTTGTLADKGRMLYVTTALLNLKGENINVEGADVSLDDVLLDYLVDQLFISELDRIVQSYKSSTGIKEYDVAAKIFTAIPSFNAINLDGKNIHEYISHPSFEKETLGVRDKLRELAKDKVLEYVNSELNAKVNFEGTDGQFVKYGIYDNTIEDEKTEGIKVKNIDTDYLNSKPGKTSLDKLRYVTTEYVINNILNLNNMHQLFLGDIAFYSKGGKISKDGKIDPIKIADPNVYGKIMESIGVIIDKRAASLIAPGLKLANSDNPLYKNNTHFMHIAVNDVESMSSVMRELIEAQYGKLNDEAIAAFEEIQKINEQLNSDISKEEKQSLGKRKEFLIESKLSDLKDYFNITGTDAQEYTTWKAHIDMLYRQGKLEDSKKALLESAYSKLSRGEEVSPEELKFLMQPVKPVYTGLVPDGNLIRPVYIKSSSFPLLPQVTKNLKMDEVRKKLETLEEKNGVYVRMSYQTANKIGSKKTKLSMDNMYNMSLDEMFNEQGTGILDSAISVLPTKNFKIQQETPSKEDKAYKKGKDAYITLGSQFFKVITGNGINKMTEPVFPNLFSEDITNRVGVTIVDGKISGEDLDRIYTNIYNEYSDTLMSELYSEIGLSSVKAFYALPATKQNNIVKNLQKIIRKEIVERGYPDYLEESVKLVQANNMLETEMPLMFDPNSHKFEALLQAVISSRLISHSLPGNSHISASSEGFERITNLEAISEKDRSGIVWLGDRGPGELKATVNKDGQIVASEVLIKSHYKTKVKTGEDTYEFKYIDLTSDEYSEPIITDGKVTGRKLKLDMIDPELLTQFSFRIPTSSHQSGVILQVVGFLPTEVGDLLLVPKEHTVQLGEDYDVDKRYIYKSNYYKDSKTGRIKKLQYAEGIKEQYETINEILSQEDLSADKLISALYGGDIIEDAEDLRQEIQDMGVDITKEGLINVGKRALAKLKIKMLENSMIDVYKSVYQSPSNEVQRKIFKPLVTDISEETANLMDNYLATDKDYTNFSILSDNYQRYLLKLGADGKGGIGVHSNAVTLEAQFQRLPATDKVRVIDHYNYDSDGNPTTPVYFIETIGKGITTLGYLGKNPKTLDGGRDIADQHGENQNVSTDNINKQIMGKRNENTHTMSVYALMAHLGFDMSLDNVNTGLKHNGPMHVPSLFINQPILRDYVELKEKYSSITAEFSKDVDGIILKELATMYGFGLQADSKGTIHQTNFLNEKMYDEVSDSMTGEKLWNNLKKDVADSDIQATVLQKFFRFQAKARALSEYQQLINLSTSELGISYFEVIQRVNTLNKMVLYNDFENIRHLVGDFVRNVTVQPGEEAALIENGYTLVGDNYWKPTTIEGKMLINSLKSAQDLMPIFFPYQNDQIYSMIKDIFAVKQIDIDKKSAASLKFKYDIMSSFNNFISSNIGLFPNNVDVERRRLFQDNETNTSLASILKHLKETKHPIMENLLLKDFNFDINKDGSGISTISHISSTSTSFDKSSKYEAFNELLQNNEELGTFNGEVITAQQLAQDLATYAFLADNENGATGFRNFITTDYLKVLGITNNYRDIFKSVINGKDKTLLENFVTQYFQHNPDRAFTLNNNNKEAKGFVPVVGSLENPDTLKEFRLNTDTMPQYVAVRNSSVKTSTKKFSLFSYDNTTDSYKSIDVLGTRGVNEYNSNNPRQKSLIPTKAKVADFKLTDHPTGVKVYINTDNNQPTAYHNIEKMLPASLGVDGILKKMYDSQSTSADYKKFIAELQEYVNLDVKFEYGPTKGNTLGQYDPNTNTITIHSNIMQEALQKSKGSLNGALNIVKEVIFEEIIHSMTVNEFSKYVSSTIGNEVHLVEGAPLFAQKLVSLYESAKLNVPYNERDVDTYYSKNIYEFIAGVFVSPEYRALLESKQEGFIESFKRILRNMFGLLYNAKEGKTLKYDQEIFTAIKDLLKTEKSTGNKGVDIVSSRHNIAEMIEQDNVSIPAVNNVTRLNKPARFTYPEIKNCK